MSSDPGVTQCLAAIRTLLSVGVLVVCAGGGGVPVAVAPSGRVDGVEAVVDKDLVSALLASEVAADALLLLTDVDAVLADWPSPARTPIRHATPAELRKVRFAPGSMGPKVEAACRFAERTGGLAAIGALEDAARLLRAEAGTVVTRSRHE